MRSLPLVAALALAALTGAAGASAAPILPAMVAPGRVALDVDGGAIADNVDGGNVASTLALPDGGSLLVGTSYAGPNTIILAHIDRAGKPVGDPVRLDLKAQKFSLLQAMLRPDGKLLLVGTEPAADVTAGAQMVIAQVTQAGVLDPSFGNGGFAPTGVIPGCGTVCPVAALTPDGGIAVTGWTGKIKPLPAPGDYSQLRWVVARLTPGGASDSAFGTNGVVTFPNPGGEGLSISVLNDGRIVADATIGSTTGPRSMLVTRLLSTGAPDPAFNAGNPVTVPFQAGFPMLAEQDGSVFLIGSHDPGPAPTFANTSQVLVRYTAAGLPDPGFGTNGVVELGKGYDAHQILPDGGSVLVISTTGVQQGALSVRRILANGTTDIALGGASGLSVPLVFGGGGSSFQVSKLPRPLPALGQNTFNGDSLVKRPDGSYIVGGGVDVTTPTGEGAGRSIFRFAAASLTPAFALDPAFGGPAAPLAAKVSVSVQRRTTAHTRHGIRVRLTSSGQGLALVKVRAAGITVAQSVVPVFVAGAQTLPVELTSRGNALLRKSSRRLHVSVSVTVRDLVASQGTATAEGALR